MTQFFLEFCCCMVISKKWMELVFRVEIGAVSLRLELLCYKNNFQGRNIHRIEIFSTVFSALAGRQRTNSHSDIVFTAHNGIYFIRTEQEMFIFLFTLLLWLLFNFRLFRFFSLDIFHVSWLIICSVPWWYENQDFVLTGVISCIRFDIQSENANFPNIFQKNCFFWLRIISIVTYIVATAIFLISVIVLRYRCYS